MLLFTGAHFLAVLEGEERDLDGLWSRLERDQRHCDLSRIADDLCATRLYPEWMMAYEVDSDVDAQIESLHSLQLEVDGNRRLTRSPSANRRLQAVGTPMWEQIVQPIMAHADSM